MKSGVQRSGLVLLMMLNEYSSTSSMICAGTSSMRFNSRNLESTVAEGPVSWGFEDPEVM